MNNKLYSVAALFDTADEIINASKETVKAGYKKFDTNTPYPVHGIEKAMSLKPSLIGIVTLIVGLSGAAFAFLFMTWVTSSNYPLIIGGKPFFTWPAFIPITFEVTVLSAALSTVGVLLFVMFRFPNNSHPLLETNYMKNVSSDKFGLTILASDKLFEEQKVKDFLASLGGKEIEFVYEVIEENKFANAFQPKFILFLIIMAGITAGATYFTLNRLLFMVPFTWMAEQPKVLPQTGSTFFADGYSMRMPVDGTVAKGFLPYDFKGVPDSLIKSLANPLPMTNEVIEKGRQRYNTYCSPCHGYFGQGDSRLKGQFPNPPSLHSEKVKKWADGNIYNVITNGQNVMPGHEKSILRNDRWAIVNYIRVLQRSLNASDSDLESK